MNQENQKYLERKAMANATFGPNNIITNTLLSNGNNKNNGNVLDSVITNVNGVVHNLSDNIEQNLLNADINSLTDIGNVAMNGLNDINNNIFNNVPSYSTELLNEIANNVNEDKNHMMKINILDDIQNIFPLGVIVGFFIIFFIQLYCITFS